ncbi:hypothetical protein Ocin01_09025 [Orchesella cincta]|uniref:Transmembrane protein n=1 Tax=Orchesella cincta TaxID=48709 RepID=A0A1D2MX94_ORCCI|nr:hypothetical protein Ocin01_09025 [Orchesella cincta]
MELFKHRVTVGRPLDKAVKLVALMDIIFAVFYCTLQLYEIEIYFKENGTEKQKSSDEEYSYTANSDINHPVNKFAAKIPHYMVIGVLVVGLLIEIWLCRLLYGAAKHGDAVALKKWWWLRCSLTVFNFLITIGRILEMELDFMDILFVLVYLWRIFELTLTFLFKRQLT